ncbi:hypothetical protein QF037_000879 [Streptomyces canus]|nr:hypothetical protein [Streptomyces canus]MDQ0596534.1 hypothetical protein [Streptomyces canus]
MNTAAQLRGLVTAMSLRDPRPALGSSRTLTFSPATRTGSTAPHVARP